MLLRMAVLITMSFSLIRRFSADEIFWRERDADWLVTYRTDTPQ